MTDVALVLKKLARIEGYLEDLRRIDPAAVERDIVAERFAEHTLQLAIQSAIDVAAHIVSDQRLGDVATSHDLFETLARNGWFPSELLVRLHAMVGFRNVLVHEYDALDRAVVREVLERRTGDLVTFVEALRGRLR